MISGGKCAEVRVAARLRQTYYTFLCKYALCKQRQIQRELRADVQVKPVQFHLCDCVCVGKVVTLLPCVRFSICPTFD